MSLSLKMGIPVRRLQHEISSSDFVLYQAFNNIDPFQDFRFDANAGIIAEIVAIAHGAKRTKISDFMVEWDKPPETKEEKQATLMAKLWNFFGKFTKKTDKKDE